MPTNSTSGKQLDFGWQVILDIKVIISQCSEFVKEILPDPWLNTHIFDILLIQIMCQQFSKTEK